MCDNPLHSQKKECLAFRKQFKAIIFFYKVTKPAAAQLHPSLHHSLLKPLAAPGAAANSPSVPSAFKKSIFQAPNTILATFPLANIPRKSLKAKAIERMSYLSPPCWFPTPDLLSQPHVGCLPGSQTCSKANPPNSNTYKEVLRQQDSNSRSAGVG